MRLYAAFICAVLAFLLWGAAIVVLVPRHSDQPPDPTTLADVLSWIAIVVAALVCTLLVGHLRRRSDAAAAMRRREWLVAHVQKRIRGGMTMEQALADLRRKTGHPFDAIFVVQRISTLGIRDATDKLRAIPAWTDAIESVDRGVGEFLEVLDGESQ